MYSFKNQTSRRLGKVGSLSRWFNHWLIGWTRLFGFITRSLYKNVYLY